MALRVGDVIPADVQAAWGLSADDTASLLPGGGNQSVQVGSVVFKPVDDNVEAAWCQECLSRLVPDRFRIAEPVRSIRGHWVDVGWSASRWIAGVAGPAGHWGELLETSARFHRSLATVARPSFLGQRSHRWAVADRAAWREAPLEWLPTARSRAQLLDDLWEPLDLPAQVIHGDLSGNVLFGAGLMPAVIDFSPYWRPAAFADAVLLMDGMLWFGGEDIMPFIPRTPTFSQLLVRAALFRLGALNEQARVNPACWDELPTFDRAIRWLTEEIY